MARCCRLRLTPSCPRNPRCPSRLRPSLRSAEDRDGRRWGFSRSLSSAHVAAAPIGGIPGRSAFPWGSYRATAGSRRTRSTSTPSSPGASPKCSPTKATWSKPPRCSPAWTRRTSRRRSRSPRRRSSRRSRASTRRSANVAQQTTQVTLAQQEFDRTSTLVARGFATNELLDQRQQALNGAIAALNAANDRVGEAERALDAATHDVELYKVNIADNTLVAPRDGRIQYRIANIGEVLPAGGKVFTMLDIAYVYMDIYLPTDEAGKVKIGADARIVLDAVPDRRDPGEGRVRRHAGAVHAQDRGDQGRARQADVPDPGEDRSRAIARARGSGEKRPARRRLCASIDPAVAWPPKLQGNAAEVIERATPGRADRGRHAALRQAWSRSTMSRSRFRPAAWSGSSGPTASASRRC